MEGQHLAPSAPLALSVADAIPARATHLCVPVMRCAVRCSVCEEEAILYPQLGRREMDATVHFQWSEATIFWGMDMDGFTDPKWHICAMSPGAGSPVGRVAREPGAGKCVGA